MVIGNLNKINVYDWFKGKQGWHRIDLLIGLVEICNPFEIRFLASCVEDYARVDYSTLKDEEMIANNPNMQDVPRRNNEEFRSRMSISLSLLYSDNYKAAHKYSNVLDKMLSSIDIPALICSQKSQADEVMLILTLASTHPAFCFEKKAKYRELFLQYEKLIFNSSRRSRLSSHNSVEETNCYLPSCHQSPTSRLSQKISTVQAFNSPESIDSSVITSSLSEARHNNTASVTYCMPSSAITSRSPASDMKIKENGDSYDFEAVMPDTPVDVCSYVTNNDESLSMELISDQSNMQPSSSNGTNIHKVNVTLDEKSTRSPTRIRFMVLWSDKTNSEVWKSFRDVSLFCEKISQHRHKVSKKNQQNVPETERKMFQILNSDVAECQQQQQQKKRNNRIHWKFVRMQHYFRDVPADEISAKYVLDFFKCNKNSESPAAEMKAETKSPESTDKNCCESLGKSSTSLNKNLTSNNSCKACHLQSIQTCKKGISGNHSSSSDSSHSITKMKSSRKQNHSPYEFDTEEDIPSETECLTPHSLHTLSKGSEFTFTFNGNYEDDVDSQPDHIPHNYNTSNIHEDTSGYSSINQPFQITQQHSIYTQHPNSIRLPSASFETVEPKIQDSGSKPPIFIYRTVPDNSANGPLRYVQPQNNSFINCPPPPFYPPPIQRLPNRTLPTTVCYPPQAYNDGGRQKHIFPMHHHHNMPPIIVPQCTNGQPIFAYGKAQDVDSDRDNNSSCSDEINKEDAISRTRNCVSVDLPSTYFPEQVMLREAWPPSCDHHPLSSHSCESLIYKHHQQYAPNNMMPYHNIYQNYYTGDGPMLSSNESYASSKPNFKPGKILHKSCFNCGSSGHTNSDCPEAGDIQQTFHLKLDPRGSRLARTSNAT